MSQSSEKPAQRVYGLPLLLSVAINIFLVAFFLGRMSPGAFFPGGPKPEMGPGMGPEMGKGPAGPMREGRNAPPPFFADMEILLGPEGAASAREDLRETFDEMSDARRDFLKLIQKPDLTKEEVLSHFADMDKIHESLRVRLQNQLADRLVSLSTEERRDTAARALLEQRRMDKAIKEKLEE